MLGAHEKPDVTYADVGGLDMQKQEIREAVELPLTHFDLYKQIGISPFPFPNDPTQLTQSRYRSPTWRVTLRSSGHRKNDAGQSGGK